MNRLPVEQPARAGRQMPQVTRVHSRAGLLLVAAALLFNAIALRTELTVRTPQLNDMVLHTRLVQNMVDAWRRGSDWLDPWVPEFALGYPVWHVYQPLPHLVAAAWVAVTGTSATTTTEFLLFALLVLFPIAVYIGARLVGLDDLQSGCAAAVAPLVNAGTIYGLEYGSYVWRGSGLYTQVWAQAFAAIAIGAVVYSLRTGRRVILAGALAAATFLCHSIYGFAVGISGILALFVLSDDRFAKRLARLAIIGASAFAGIAFFILPLLIDRAGINRSRWELPYKWDSYGAQHVLTNLFKGSLFDSDRLPIVTLLLAAGIVWTIWNRRRATPYLAVAFAAWLILYFGRATWGMLMSLIPLTRDLPLHRLIGPVHLFGIWLAGIGLAAIVAFIASRVSLMRNVAAPLVLCAIVLAPAAYERLQFMKQSVVWQEETLRAFARDGRDLDAMFARMKAEPHGRVYAGRAATWGRGVKIGQVPLYATVAAAGFDSNSFLYHAMSPPADALIRFDDARPDHYALFNVGWVCADASVPLPSFLGAPERFGRFRLYRAPAALPLAAFHATQYAVTDPRDHYAWSDFWMSSGGAAANDALILVAPGDRPPRLRLISEPDQYVPPAQHPAASLQNIRVSRESAEARVTTAADAIVIRKASWHPRWRASVDGNEAPTLLVAPGFVGVEVPRGTHDVRLRYVTQPWRTPLAFLGVILLVAGTALERKRSTEAIAERFDSLVSAGAGAGSVIRQSRAARWLIAHRLGIAALLSLTIVGAIPLLQPKLLSGHDTLNYLPRLVDFHENVRNFILLPRWSPSLGSGHGEPMWVLSPPLFQIVSEAFRLLGAGAIAAENLALLVLYLLGGATMYAIGDRWGRLPAAITAACAYLFGNYVLFDLYVRHAAAEFAGLSFLPLIILGMDGIRRGLGRRQVAYAAAGVAGAGLSHNVVFLAAVPMALLLTASMWIATKERWKTINALAGTAFGIALAAYAWVPALIEKQYSKVDLLREGYLDYSNHFVTFRQLIYSRWGYGLSVAGGNDDLSFEIGIVLVVLAAIGVWKQRRTPIENRIWTWALVATAAAGAFLSLGISGVIWDHVVTLQYLAFPWRLLMLPAIALPPLAALAVGDKPRTALVAVVALLAFSVMHARPSGYLNVTEEQYAPERIAAKGFTATTKSEYQPRWVKKAPQYSPVPFEPEVDAKPLAIDPVLRRYLIDNPAARTMRIHLFYFPGWTATLDGRPLAIEPAEGTGTIEFHLPAGRHEIEFRFRRTAVRLASELLSLLGLLGLVGFLMINRYTRRTIAITIAALVALFAGITGIAHAAEQNAAKRGAARVAATQREATTGVAQLPQLIARGLKLMAAAQYQEARDVFLEAERLQPGYSTTQVNLGIVTDRLGDPQRAEQHFRRAIELRNDADGHFFYARWLLERGRGEEAVQHLATAWPLRPSPSATEAGVKLLQITQARGQVSAARVLAGQIITVDPSDESVVDFLRDPYSSVGIKGSDADAAVSLGLEKMRAGDYVAAALADRYAVTVDPKNAAAFNNLGWSLYKLGFAANALPAYDAALALQPGTELYLNNRRAAAAVIQPPPK